MSQATIYLARAPKSNAVKSAYHAAADRRGRNAREPVPLHLRNAATPLMKHVGYGKGYRYVHSDPAREGRDGMLAGSTARQKYFSTRI